MLSLVYFGRTATLLAKAACDRGHGNANSQVQARRDPVLMVTSYRASMFCPRDAEASCVPEVLPSFTGVGHPYNGWACSLSRYCINPTKSYRCNRPEPFLSGPVIFTDVCDRRMAVQYGTVESRLESIYATQAASPPRHGLASRRRDGELHSHLMLLKLPILAMPSFTQVV